MATRVRLEVGEDGVAVVTLDGPDTLNAFSADVGRDLSAAYRRCDEDDAVRAVVLTGAGRAFCSGADLSPGSDPFAQPGEGFSASPVEPPAFRLRPLVVAAVNGPADEVLPAALALARDVAANANPASVALSKQILWSDLDADATADAETQAHRRLMMNHTADGSSPVTRPKRD